LRANAVLLALVLPALAAASPAADPPAPSLAVLYTGDGRGQVAPCG
jgi:hypothetical protein